VASADENYGFVLVLEGETSDLRTNRALTQEDSDWHLWRHFGAGAELFDYLLCPTRPFVMCLVNVSRQFDASWLASSRCMTRDVENVD
jgi:hypothetical protein